METAFRPSRQPQFGKRKDLHKIIIARGDDVTSMTIHPWIAVGGAFCIVLMALSYLTATGYLMLRDDLLNASQIRQARVQHAYEDRLASLRVEIDRIASRQMLDQRSVENKLDRLLGQRTSLDERWKTVNALTQLASNAGISTPALPPNPRVNPAKENSALSADGRVDPSPTASLLTGYASTDVRQTDNPLNDLSVNLEAIESRLNDEKKAQLNGLRLINTKTQAAANEISGVLNGLGVPTPAPTTENSAVGGPFHPAGDISSFAFDNTLLSFEENLNHLNTLKTKARELPIKRPVRGATVSSNFGPRIDPFLGRNAFHAGIDFRARTGTNVLSTAPGKVVKAGWHGGYGRMVEIRHANGISTRYAHLSALSVKKGQTVSAGERIGRVGSTGRSTGPHLHYEVRLNKKAVNPTRFLNAGRRIQDYL